MVNAHWQRLPFHFPNLQLDAFVVMPNHIHGILDLTSPSCRGAALGKDLENSTDHLCPNATPNPDRLSEPGVALGDESLHLSEPGVAFGREMVAKIEHQLPNAAPLRPRLVSGGAIVLNFKSVTTRSGNRMQRSPGTTIWQRNYYEHIIRSEESLHRIRQYIHHNHLSWQQDQLHPDNSSNW
jgi:putative transposase